MAVITKQLNLETRGHADMVDITQPVSQAVATTDLHSGTITIFCPSATSGITTIEYESGALSDFRRLFDEIAAEDRDYHHNQRWGDGNGHSHVRAALLGASLTVPFVDSRLTLGTWQQIVYIDFDNRARERSLVLQIIGE